MTVLRTLSLGLLLACVASDSAAQGMGEAAAREKQRREEQEKKKGASKTYTNKDLSGGTEGSSGTSAGLARDAQRPVRQVAPDRPEEAEEEDVDRKPGAGKAAAASDGKNQEYWRDAAARAREAMKRAEAGVGAAEQQAQRLQADVLRSTDNNQLLRLRAQQQQANEALERSKAGLAEARRAWTELEEQARRAGAPPGWIR